MTRNLGDESSKCQIDYFIVDSSGGNISRNCSLDNDDDDIIFDGHHLSSQSDLKFKLPAGSTQGFTLIFTALPLYSMTSSTQTVSAVTSPSGYIMSHTGFNIQLAKNYGNNLHNRLNLTDIRGVTGIHVEFIFMAIGPSTECGSSGDLFELYEIVDGEYNQLYYCYDTQVPPPSQNLSINSLANYLIFEFKSDSISDYNGILLKYTVPSVAPDENKLLPSMKEFFAKQTNIIAVAAGGGGLILMIVIIVLACLLCKKRGSRAPDKTKEEDVEILYAVVNKPKVEMIDNDLYASRESLSSSEENE
ncbi:hypothetical protein EB796_008283 [Bugula neritina]|uniref:CUB domain-containing protein n=1 Tax=Bugula neritina TaxID=10212 RepID=A0A7J7K449_BUGNE|nr:hypothetical protein EB796_008283 [Bugula neritina]